MTFKTIPYPTAKNIKLQKKGGSNGYWLAFRFYNMRYPLKKVEFSADGVTFTEVSKLSGIENNWYKTESSDGTLLSGSHYFRLTDVYNQVVVTKNAGSFAENGTYDLGVNFNK